MDDQERETVFDHGRHRRVAEISTSNRRRVLPTSSSRDGWLDGSSGVVVVVLLLRWYLLLRQGPQGLQSFVFGLEHGMFLFQLL